MTTPIAEYVCCSSSGKKGQTRRAGALDFAVRPQQSSKACTTHAEAITATQPAQAQVHLPNLTFLSTHGICGSRLDGYHTLWRQNHISTSSKYTLPRLHLAEKPLQRQRLHTKVLPRNLWFLRSHGIQYFNSYAVEHLLHRSFD